MQHPRLATRRSRAFRSSRAATSLTEMLVVMTVASVIIGVSGMMIHRLLAAEHDATRTARYTASTSRLSRAFRADMHAARSVDLPVPNAAQPAVVVATLADRHDVRYEFDAHLATRIETRDGKTIHRDNFHFPPRSQLQCGRSDDGTVLKLEIDVAAKGPESAADRPSRKLTIEATLARDHRFAAKPQTEGQTP